MRSKHRLQDLIFAVRTNDSETVEEMLANNSGLLNHPLSVDGRLLLVSEVVNCRSKEMIDILVNFLGGYEKLGKKRKLQQHLLTAVTAGNVRASELLLAKGAKLAGQQWSDVDSVACRIFHNTHIVDTRLEMLKLLLNHGLLQVILSRNERGGIQLFRQFILHAERHDRDVTEIAEILVDSGISIEEAYNYGITPLHHAVMKRNIVLVSYLINKGANVNASDDDDETALYDACFANCVEIIGLLLRKGARISPINVYGESPFSQLYFEDDSCGPCVEVMVKEFAKMSFENLPICQVDLELIQKKPRVRELFDKCTSELQLMSSTKFYRAYTCYSVLKMSKNMRKLAHLAKNEEFLTKFKANLQEFAFYEKELRAIMDEAIKYRNELIEVQSRLVAVFVDYLPELVIRILASNLCLEDLPLN